MLKNKPQFFKILSGSLIILIVLLLVSIGGNIIKAISLNTQKQSLQNELATLEKDIAENKTQIDYMQSSDFVDKFAHEHLDVSRTDEEVYQGAEK